MLSRERLEADARSLRALAALNPGCIKVVASSPDLRHYEVDVHLDAPVATTKGYAIVPQHRVTVEIPDNYLTRDGNGLFIKSRIRRQGERIYHPNVWPSDGYFCFDDQFYPAKTIADQFASALELMQCRAVNHDSPADWEADYFFLQNAPAIRAQLRQVPIRLPTASLRLGERALPRLS
jgi:hypothetical protein